MTCDMFKGGGNILSKFQLPSYYRYYEDLEEKDDLIN